MARSKPWTARRCAHGPVDYRAQFDFTHCRERGCFDAAIRRAGFAYVEPLKGCDEDAAGALVRVVRSEVARLPEGERAATIAKVLALLEADHAE